MLAAGVFLVTNRCYYLAVPWGGWDAWGIWNYHARFLMDDVQWRHVFLSTHFDHPDYPLFLPANIAWITRLFGKEHLMMVSFGLSFFFTLLIPTLVFTALYRKSLFVATGIMVLFATNDFYLEAGVSQYADTPLAAFLLAAIICIHASKDDKRMLLPAAFFAASMGWIKNEGIALGLIFFLFYGKAYLSRYGLKSFVAGVALPLLTLAVFKIGYAPGNDLLEKSQGVWEKLADAGRYRITWQYFSQNATMNFMPLIYLFGAYLAVCAWQRKWPDRAIWLLLTCHAAYFLTYVLTPYDPTWHLRTSQERLMHQLMPAMMAVIGERLCTLRLPPLLRKKALL
jgi:hypothetical protein